MTYAYKSPGVYREEVYIRPAAALPTGVPGFVGFGRLKDGTEGPVLLHRAEELDDRFDPAEGSYLTDAVAGFFANGGARCYVSGALSTGDPPAQLKNGLNRLGQLTDLDLVAVPDAMALAEDAALHVQSAAIAHCSDHGNRFAVLDAPAGKDPAKDAAAALKDWHRRLMLAVVQPKSGARYFPGNAALYYPWVKVAAAGVIGGRPVPPSGHVAGVYARSDARIGVFKAPANEELHGVLDLEFPIDASLQDRLNPDNINCLRAFPGRGLRVWGARTLSLDADWRYISVRRLFLTLMRWIDRNLAWAAFESNTPQLWVRIQRELNVHLGRLWEAGALKGATAAEAFYVKCDAETNPMDEREQGRVTTEIGLATAAPAEFVVVRIFHRAGAAQSS